MPAPRITVKRLKKGAPPDSARVGQELGAQIAAVEIPLAPAAPEDPRTELLKYVTGLAPSAATDTLSVLRVLNAMVPDGLKTVLENLKAGEAAALRLTQVEQLPIHSAYLTPTADGTFEVRIDRPGEPPIYYNGMGKFVGTDGAAVQIDAMRVPLGALEVLHQAASTLNAGLRFGANAKGLEALLPAAEEQVARAGRLAVSEAETRVAAALKLPAPEELTKYLDVLPRLQAYDEKLAALAAQLGPLESRSNTLAGKLTAQAQAVDVVGRSVAELQASLKTYTITLENLAGNVDGLQKLYDEKLQAVQAIDVQGLTKQVQEREGQITDLTQTVDGLVAAASRFGGQLAAMEGMDAEVAALGRRIEEAKGALSEYVEQRQTLRGQYERVQAAFGQAEQGLGELKTIISGKTQEARTSYDTFSGLMQGLTGRAKGFEGLLDRAKELEGRLADAETVARGLPDTTELRRRYELVQATLHEGEALGDLLAVYKTRLEGWQTAGRGLYDGMAGRLKTLGIAVDAQSAALEGRRDAIVQLGASVTKQEDVLAQLGPRLEKAMQRLAQMEAAGAAVPKRLKAE